MKLLPSKFAVGNGLFSLVIFLTFALPFFFIDYPTALIAYIISPFISYAIVKLHRSRAEQHQVAIKSVPQLIYESNQLFEKGIGILEQVELRVTINQPEGG